MVDYHIWYNIHHIQVVGVVNVTTLTNRQYCIILDPVGKDGKPQLGQKKLVKGEKSFFLQPGERLEKGIQNVFVLGEDEGLILKANQAFKDPESMSKSSDNIHIIYDTIYVDLYTYVCVTVFLLIRAL